MIGGTELAAALDEAGGDRANEPVNGAENPPTAEPQVLGDSPLVLNAPAQPMTAFSGLLHIEAEAVSAGGSHFAREAVVALERRKTLAYRLRLWRRGVRVLFPASDQAR